MNTIRPGILVGSLAILILAGLLIWATGPTSLDEPGTHRPASEQAAPAAATRQPAPETRAKTTTVEAVEATETVEKAAEPATRKVPGRKYQEKLKREKLARREKALDRLAELSYPQSEAERIRDHWESTIDKVEADLAEREFLGENIDGTVRRMEFDAAYHQLRSDFGEDDYVSARYADGKSTQLRLVDIRPNSPAANAGFWPGDKLVGPLNEPAFTSNDDYKDFLASQEGEGTVVYLVERDGKVLQIQVDRGGFLGTTTNGFSDPP
jgi:membrane-associated protease RseP (regulator of RpoE activity)